MQVVWTWNLDFEYYILLECLALLEAQNSFSRESKTRERRCSIEKNKRRFMLWFFHSRVFPRPGNRTGDQATGIFLSLSEQESHSKQALSACRKASYRMYVWIETFGPIAHILKPNLTCCLHLTISHVHMRFRTGDTNIFAHLKASEKFRYLSIDVLNCLPIMPNQV